LQDALERGDTRTEQVGKRIYLSSSHTGRSKNMAQNCQDAVAVSRWVGYPNLFVTFMCNAKWPEIQYMLDEAKLNQKPTDQADVIVRVFMIKLKALLRDIVIGKRFEETTAGKCHKPLYIYVYEILMPNTSYGFLMQFPTQ
jgi:hypothetical protein